MTPALSVALAALAAMMMAAPVSAAESWRGLYRTADGTVLGVGEFDEFGSAQVLVDYASGQVGALFPLADGRTGVGRAIGVAQPPAVHVLERKAGQAYIDGRPLTPVAVRRRAFTVRSGEVALAGELARPAGRPKGVLVLVHGSGPGPIGHYDVWTNLFLARGWAVVAFDKRGSGASTGDWPSASLQVLAGDVRAVLAWTRVQNELAGLKVGLWGVSQAGWIIPQIAADRTADFAIVQAGPAVTTGEFVGQTVEAELTAYGFAPDEIARAKAYYALDEAVSRGERPFAELQGAYDRAHAAGAEWLLAPPAPAGASERKLIASIAGFDPASWWRRTRIPLLAVYGGKDVIVPVGPNRARLERFLAEAGARQAQVVTLPDDNHLNMLAKTGVRSEYPTLDRFDPAYLRLIGRFLDRMASSGPGG